VCLYKETQKITYYSKKLNQRHVHRHVIISHSPLNTRVKVTLFARLLLTLVAQNPRRHEHLLTLEHCSVSKSFAALRKESSNAYSDQERKTKIILHWLVTKILNSTSVTDKYISLAGITAVPTSSSAPTATIFYGCKYSILLSFSSFCSWRSSCVILRIAV
jgi:hypothetical protein